MRKFIRIGPAACLAAVLLVSTQAHASRGGGFGGFHGGFGGFRHFDGFHRGFGFRPGFSFRGRFGFRDGFGFRRELFGFGFAPGFVGYGYPFGWRYFAGSPYFYYPYYPY